MGFWKVAIEGGKYYLSLMMETIEYFEDSPMWLNPKGVKMNLSCLNDQQKVNFMISSTCKEKVSKSVSEKRKRFQTIESGFCKVKLDP